MAKPPKIFVSYSHKDRAWLERLQVHFKALERDGTVDLWDDTEIRYGADWDAEIESALDHAKAAILLVSADFLASDYIINEELKDLLEAGEKKGLLNLMVILRPCMLGKLARFQSINDPEEPLEGMSRVEQEMVFVKLVETIKKVLTVNPEVKIPEPGRQRDQKNTPTPYLKLRVSHKDNPDQSPNTHEFHQERITIGRDQANDLRLSDPLKVTSKHHAEITCDNGKLYLTDLNSMNFTHLNDKRLHPHQPYEVQPGSIIRIGQFEIGIESLGTESDDDRTYIEIANPYKNDVEKLFAVLRRIGENYSRETSRRDEVLLQNALRSEMSNTEQNEACLLIARWLLRDIDNSSLPH